MKCDACGSTEEIIDCRSSTNQVYVCENCFCRSHIAIAAKINTRKNEEIEAKDAVIARLRKIILKEISCENCKHLYTDCLETRGECTAFAEKWEAK
jgi:hypothetical protein